MGFIPPPFPRKPDWMSEKDFCENILKPCLESTERAQQKYNTSVGPWMAALAILLPFLIAAAVVAAMRL